MSRPAPARDVSAADWVVEALQTFGESVLSLVPAGFSSYVRVFHPAWRLDEHGEPKIPVRWADVALAKGTHTNPGMQFRALMGALTFEYNLDPEPGLFDAQPEAGSLDRALIQALAAILARHTATPERCWYAIWDGHAAMRAEILSAPTFHLPARDYHLLVGPVAAAAESALGVPYHQSPTCGGWMTGRGSSPPRSTSTRPMSATQTHAARRSSKHPSLRSPRSTLRAESIGIATR